MSLEPFAENGQINVVIEAVRGSGRKFKYQPQHDIFFLHTVLPKGIEFPYDFGFVPGMAGDDRDPVDVLVLMDTQAFPGCLVRARVIGVERKCSTWADVRTIDDLPKSSLDYIEHFFVSYNELRGTKFIPQGRRGPGPAEKMIRQGAKKYHQAASAEAG